MFRDPVHRDVLRRLWLGGNGAQPFTLTWFDRYPEIFVKTQQLVGRDKAAKLLSFGCSTGEEVMTLRGYFPNAMIKGIDVNRPAIRQAKRAAGADARLAFVVASNTDEEPDNGYDAIFCMAVLRHGRLGANPPALCTPLLHFADFARTIDDFRRCLKPGGLLVVRHSHFRVRDTAAATGLTLIWSKPYSRFGPRTLYGPDNRLMPGINDTETIFRKP